MIKVDRTSLPLMPNRKGSDAGRSVKKTETENAVSFEEERKQGQNQQNLSEKREQNRKQRLASKNPNRASAQGLDLVV